MFLQHHISNREDRLTARNAVDQLGILAIAELEQAHGRVHRSEQGKVLAIQRDELLQETEQVASLAVFDEDGGDFTAGRRAA